MPRLVALVLLLLSPWAAGAEAERVEPPRIPSPRPALLSGRLETAGFHLFHTARAAAAAPKVLQRLEVARAQFNGLVGRGWEGTIEVRLGMGREEFEALALPGGAPPPWAVALAYPSRQLVLFEAGSLLNADGAQTLLHEVTHAALGSFGVGWPRWFQEGLAMELAGERFAFARYARLVRANAQDRLFRFEDLAGRWPEHVSEVEVAYAQSYGFVGFLVKEHGPVKLSGLLDRVGAGESFEDAFARALGASVSYEEERWRKTVPGKLAWFLMVDSLTTWLGLAALLTVIAFVRRRILMARRLEEFSREEAAEAAEDAEIAALEEELRRSQQADDVAPSNDQDKPLLH